MVIVVHAQAVDPSFAPLRDLVRTPQYELSISLSIPAWVISISLSLPG